MVKILPYPRLLFSVTLDCSRRKVLASLPDSVLSSKGAKSYSSVCPKDKEMKRIWKASSPKTKFQDYYKSSLTRRI